MPKSYTFPSFVAQENIPDKHNTFTTNSYAKYHSKDPKVDSKTANYIQMADNQRRQCIVEVYCLPFFGS